MQANVEAAANDGTTALIFSAQNGHDACVRELLAAQVCVPCDHVPADMRRPAWMAVCACCVGEREGGGPGRLVCRTQDAGAFGGVCVCGSGWRCGLERPAVGLMRR